MKNLLILLLLLFCFTGCTVSFNVDNEVGYGYYLVISKISKIENLENNNLIKYECKKIPSHNIFPPAFIKMFFYDVNGKYSVGDTLILTENGTD